MRRLKDYVFLALLIGALVFAYRFFNNDQNSQAGWVRVVDGDSLRMAGRDIRLFGIDAPELHQFCRRANGSRYPCGRRAKQHLVSLITNKKVRCITIDQDRYGRDVARCNIGPLSLNRQMVADGWAVAFRRYSFDFVQDEKQAKRHKRGLWQGQFQTPALWRSLNR